MPKRRRLSAPNQSLSELYYIIAPLGYPPETCYSNNMGLLDIIFPKYCVVCKQLGEYLCTDCFARVSFDVPTICLVCGKQAINGQTHPVCKGKHTIDGSMASVVYAGVVKKMVYQFKYRPHLTDLQNLLGDFFYEGLIQQEQFHRILQTETVFVPIPQHKSKQLERGYNHAQLLSETLGMRLNIRTIPFLERVKKTKTQASLKKEERVQNMRQAFRLRQEYLSLLEGKQVLLVDDIITSGATMQEATAVLKRAGIQTVWGVAFAHGL
jgi:competence protein ComFC